jgi:hypothetical protein
MFDLVEMQRERELLLTEAQRLVRIQPEIAHGLHRQVETNLIVRSCYRGPTNWLIAPRVRTASSARTFLTTSLASISAHVIVPANPRSCVMNGAPGFHTHRPMLGPSTNNRRDYFNSSMVLCLDVVHALDRTKRRRMLRLVE